MDAVTLNVLLDDLVEMNDIMTDVAAGEALAPLLFLAGMVLMLFSIAAFGLLSLGAFASLFTLE